MRFYLAVPVVALAAALVGCGGSDSSRPAGSPPGTYVGPTAPLGGSTAHSFITFGAGGTPTAYGVAFPEAALSSLPPSAFNEPHSYFFEMPPQASVTPINHIELRWWAHGHDPVDLFTTAAHIDFLFFLLSPAERDRITATGDDLARALRVPRADRIPIGFSTIPNVDASYAEPRFGTTYFDVPRFSPVLNGEEAFTRVLFYGFYNGTVSFLEVPITGPVMGSKQEIADPATLPKTVDRHGYWPRSYHFRFNPATSEYAFSFEDLTLK